MGADDTKEMIETIDASPRLPDITGEEQGSDVFRQLLHQPVRVADLANAQAMRMALDFAKVYAREQGVRHEFQSQLKQMTLMEKQATRYAEDLASMLRSERERRQELERALEQERVANEELRRTGLQGISHLLLAATIKDRTTGEHLQRVRGYVEAIAQRLGLPADVFDALTSKRPYKDAWSADAGLKAIEKDAGERFDPEVVSAFVALSREGVVETIRFEVAANAPAQNGSSAK